MRKPQYTKNREWRIVSVPNGLWQLQKTDGSAGTKTHDPWQGISPALELTEAQALLGSKQPVKGGGQ